MPPLDIGQAYYEAMSPTLLAQQPVKEPAVAEKDDEDWGQVFSHLESRLGMMRTWRYSWWAYWAQLAEYILPSQYKWLVTSNLMNRGNPINQAIVDSTATLGMEICAAGFIDGVMPSTREWFKFGPPPGLDPDQQAQEWYEDTQAAVEQVLGGSNFYEIMAQVAKNLVVFGTAPVIVYEDAEDGIRCYSPCAGEYYLSVGSRLSVDTFYREFTLTIAQLIEMFSFEACPPQVQELWDAGGASLEMEYTVAHSIEPNFPIQGRGRSRGAKIQYVKGGFTYREVYWLKGMKTPHPLSKRGFHEKPFAASRWSVVSNDAYGRGPGMDALGDTKQLQLETRRKAEAIDKHVRPPMGADVELKEQPTSILPGHVTFMDSTSGKKGYWPLFEVQPILSEMVEDLKEIQSRIERCFLVDVFMAITQMEGVQPRNDLEITERKAEKLQRLGPVIGLWKSEVAPVILMRVLAIMRRKGLVKPPPASLKNIPLKITYLDMVTVAQLGADTASMERTFQIAGSLSEAAKAAGRPDPSRVLNIDQAMRTYAEKVNFPADCIYTDDQVKQNDAMAAKAQQQAQAPQNAMAAVQAAQGLSQTNLGGGQNALSALLGLNGGGQGAPNLQ